MAGFRAALVSQDLEHGDPPRLAERLNGFLNDSLDPGKFVTAFLAIVDGTTGRFAYVNAGHNPPLLLRNDGTLESLDAGGTILGILPGTRYDRGQVTLAPGDLVVLYTDGVPEGTSVTNELWGDDRLAAAVRAYAARPCDEVVHAIAADVRAFEAERGPADDVTLIAVRRTSV
jgi:sigma-B regulation protein RsbU (phosphoserine phosphatase)